MSSNNALTDSSPKALNDLHKVLKTEQINELHTYFKKSERDDKELAEDELRDILHTEFGVHFEKDEFHAIFKKIDIDGNGFCSWNEFLSYLLFLFRADDGNKQTNDLNLPIEDGPTRRRSNHVYPIVRIRYCPHVSYDGTVNHRKGIYLTASKDGTINTWNVDFQLLKTDKSANPSLVVAKTWVLDFLFLPNVEILCTSSIECDLRFYDTRAGSFQLCLVVSNFPCAINAMHYSYPEKRREGTSKIVLGDWNGNVVLLEFDAKQRGPFQSNTANDFQEVRWQHLLMGHPKLFNIQVFSSTHTDIVTQVEYCVEMNAIFSSSECEQVQSGSRLGPGLVISDLGVHRTKTIFRMPRGVRCFAIDNNNAFTAATGGPDNMLRLWNHVVPDKAAAILSGHQAGITYVFIQDNARKIYSFDRNKILIVWDVAKEESIQTYNTLANVINDHCFLTAFYNDAMRQLIIGGMQSNIVTCSPLLDLDVTDGFTHKRTVSVVLYNKIFRTILTCGFDSSIMDWNPWNGKRITYIKNAHTMLFYGEIVRVEITAACFNPTEHLLLTGARNGTLKVWNYNNSVCIRNLSIESMCEVTNVFWLPQRILAIGWDKHVTEFAESLGQSLTTRWVRCHNEEIISSAISAEAIVTGSYNGELVFWELRAGHPYRQHSVGNPSEKIPIIFDGLNIKLPSKTLFTKWDPTAWKSEDERARQISIIQLPSNVMADFSNNSVNTMIFLQRRTMSPDHGTLVVALSNGMVQFYSHHPLGGYMNGFNAIHMAGDSIVALATDENNALLFSGTALGYIKTWHIRNYCIPEEDEVHVNMPRLRLKFPFLIHDLWEGRAKRTARYLENPLLVNSYKAHLRSLSCLVFIEDCEILVSSSSDCTVRLWTLGGTYLRTLGSSIDRPDLWPERPTENREHRIPPDLTRVASSTTVKVLTDASRMDALKKLQLVHREKQKIAEDNNAVEVEGSGASSVVHIREPILGDKYALPPHFAATENPKLNSGFPVPIYKHLNIYEARLIEEVPTPNEINNDADRDNITRYLK